MKTINLFILLFALLPISAIAQHQHNTDTTKHHSMPMHHMADTTKKMGGMDMSGMGDMDMSGMQGMHHHMADTGMHHMHMNSQLSLTLPMNRDGSGTSWVPDETPMYGYMIHGKKWMTMIHGNIFVRYEKQDLFNSGSRGGSHFDAPDWLMLMSQRKVGTSGLFAVNAMLSLDPLLVGNAGYPLLFQTGESYKGVKLVDRQHPHDLFDELNVAYTQQLSHSTDLYASVGYPGEPALGPPVFMHRLSSLDNPDAPLTHHYADATHITFGVATLGLRVSNVKFEGSVFTGREPDEQRYDFDKPRFDSYSVRLSFNPGKEWALQVSEGWIHSPEALEPQQNVDRFTASVMHTKRLNKDGFISTTLVFGQNHFTDNGKTLPSVLLESDLHTGKTAIYGKYEYVQKDAEELNLAYPADPVYNINAVTLGVNRVLATHFKTELRAGLQGTLNFSPAALQPLYGTTPVGFEVYLRITPSWHM